MKGEEPASKGSDLWALGCIIYFMSYGKTPFRSSTEFLTFQSILNYCNGSQTINFPTRESNDESVKDIITKLLNPNSIERLGAVDRG